MTNHKNLENLFAESLKDIYFAEKQILRALPKMARERDNRFKGTCRRRLVHDQ